MSRRRLLMAVVIVIVVLLSAATAFGASGALTAHLTGANEMPPVETKARGQTVFMLSPDGMELYYRLIVANIQDVTAARIHLAPAGVNGPVVAYLFSGPLPGTINGDLAQGTLTSADLIGPLAGMAMDDLLDNIMSGDAYVNVHTLANPAGEIRGQIR
ncbi:MAG: CHRD domain-containing protein [Anaerosomatales bacterium]|nr:CHRD domain-containing protein [Anaerosomatales bacterium]